MAMRKWKFMSFYINFENFTDTRQHRLEAFDINQHLQPHAAQIWAPLDGRIINAGVILDL
ncbi:MAG TPA: hypothetical protein DCR93_15015, partial [Cytophagales bacterium]|nr:hypothetical protein [Cytophagales bacterium]